MTEKATRSSRGRYGVSRQQWLAAALGLLEERGIEAVRIQPIAAKLGVSKSGFYWHFRDRDELLTSLLGYWTDLEEHPLLAIGSEAAASPQQVLTAMADVVDRENLSRYDAAIRQWARTDERVAEIYRSKMDRRLTLVRAMFTELGFEGAAADMRARTYVAFVSTEREVFRDQTAEERAALRDAQLALLLAKPV